MWEKRVGKRHGKTLHPTPLWVSGTNNVFRSAGVQHMVAVGSWFGRDVCAVRAPRVAVGRRALLGVRLLGQFLARKGVDRDQFV